MGTLSGHLSAFSQAMLTKGTRQTIDLSVSLCMQPFSLPYICLWGHSPPVGTMPMVRPSLAVPNWFAHFTSDCRIVSHLIPYCHSLLWALTKTSALYFAQSGNCPVALPANSGRHSWASAASNGAPMFICLYLPITGHSSALHLISLVIWVARALTFPTCRFFLCRKPGKCVLFCSLPPYVYIWFAHYAQLPCFCSARARSHATTAINSRDREV